MSPLAFVQCVLYAHFSGELHQVRAYSHQITKGKTLALAFNGVIAFGLNVVSFTANKKVGAVSMTVAGLSFALTSVFHIRAHGCGTANVKQALTIMLAVMIFDLTITSINALGILLAIAGGAWYALVEHREKKLR